MKLKLDRLSIVLAFSLTCVVTRAVAQDDGGKKKMMANLAKTMAGLDNIAKCIKQYQAQNKQRVQELEAAKANASLPPQEMQQVEQEIQVLKAANVKTDALLAEPLPTTREAHKVYLSKALGEIAKTREFESSVAKDLGVDPASRMGLVLSNLNLSVKEFETQFGAFDQQKPAGNADPNAPVPQEGKNSHFFGLSGQLPPSAVPTIQVSSAYTATTVPVCKRPQMNTDIGCVPGGVAMLVAGSSPSPIANAIAHAARSGRRDSGKTTRKNCPHGPLPSSAHASRYSWGNDLRNGQSKRSE